MNLCNNAEDGLIRMLNTGNFFIFYDLVYFIGGEESSFGSDFLSTGQACQISIPGLAYDIKVDVYTSPDEFTWNKKVTLTYNIPGDYCFEASGTATSPIITRVPCQNSCENCNCCCKKL